MSRKPSIVQEFEQFDLFEMPVTAPAIPNAIDPVERTGSERWVRSKPASKNAQQVELSVRVPQTEAAHLQAYKSLLHVFGSVNRSENLQAAYTASPSAATHVIGPKLRIDIDRAYTGSVNNRVPGHERKGRKIISEMLGHKAMVQARILTEEQAELIAETTFHYYEDMYSGLDDTKIHDRELELARIRRRLKRIKEDQ